MMVFFNSIGFFLPKCFKTEAWFRLSGNMVAIFIFYFFGIFISICLAGINVVFHRYVQLAGFFTLITAGSNIDLSIANRGDT